MFFPGWHYPEGSTQTSDPIPHPITDPTSENPSEDIVMLPIGYNRDNYEKAREIFNTFVEEIGLLENDPSQDEALSICENMRQNIQKLSGIISTMLEQLHESLQEVNVELLDKERELVENNENLEKVCANIRETESRLAGLETNKQQIQQAINSINGDIEYYRNKIKKEKRKFFDFFCRKKDAAEKKLHEKLRERDELYKEIEINRKTLQQNIEIKQKLECNQKGLEEQKSDCDETIKKLGQEFNHINEIHTNLSIIKSKIEFLNDDIDIMEGYIDLDMLKSTTASSDFKDLLETIQEEFENELERAE